MVGYIRRWLDWIAANALRTRVALTLAIFPGLLVGVVASDYLERWGLSSRQANIAGLLVALLIAVACGLLGGSILGLGDHIDHTNAE